jgi:phosphoglycerate dehydrogenase-like enzyme
MRVAMPLALLLLLGPAMVQALEPANDGERLMAEYGLREAAEPVAKFPGWRAPRKIVVDAGVPGLVALLREAAPTVDVIGAHSISEMTAAAPSADAFFGRSAIICNERALAAAKNLRWVQSVYAGVELCANKPAFRERGILLTNMRAVGSVTVAEHAIGLMFALSRGMAAWIPLQKQGVWAETDVTTPQVVLTGKTLLVVGLGGIGTEIAKRGHALGMRVIATRSSRQERPDYVDYVGTADELKTLIGQADVVINAAPLTPATTGIFDAKLFSNMRRNAYFINVGRGASVITMDLVEALQKKTIAGAGLDVTDPEPLPKDHPLWTAPNTIVTPHVAGQSDLGIQPQLRLLRENLRRYVAGEKMLSVVGIERGY